MRNLMNNSLRMLLSAFLLMILLSCQDKAKEEKQYSPITQKLVDLVKSDERIKSLLMEAIEKGKKINPDSSTNPAQSLEEYYNFIDHSQTAMPWDVIFCPGQPSIFGRMYQALCYCYFINCMPLEALAHSKNSFFCKKYIKSATKPFKRPSCVYTSSHY